jgi:uncharacterized protein (DUF1697 family)
MPTFVALLRGVNVGNNALPMQRLRDIFAELGAGDVQTYIQSGNVVFKGKGAAAGWQRAIERRLTGEARLPIACLVRTSPELKRMIAANPFVGDRSVDEAKLHVTLLAKTAPKTAQATLDALRRGDERVEVVRNSVFLYCPHGYGTSKLTNGAVEKAAGAKATTRNWRTLQRLVEMAAFA